MSNEIVLAIVLAINLAFAGLAVLVHVKGWLG